MIFHFCEALLAVYGLLNLSVKGINAIYQRFKNIPNFINNLMLPHPAEGWELTDNDRRWSEVFGYSHFKVGEYDGGLGSPTFAVFINGSKFIEGWRAERLFDAIKAEYCERHALNGL